MKPLFLASNSPRRAALLLQLELDFEVRAPKINERILNTGSDDDIITIVCENALQKVLSIISTIETGLIIGGDTLVVTDENLVLGKPKTTDEALQMLDKLVGKTHRVISAVAIVDVSTQERKVGHIWTKVVFRNITREELYQYVLTQEPIGKAGGYAIQGKGSCLIDSIDGSYTAVIGLPMELVVSFLKQFGIQPKSTEWLKNPEQS